MNWFSLRFSRLKFETSGEIPIIFEESIEDTPNERGITSHDIASWIA